MQIQRKDFLERIIEEFAEVLASLAGLRKTRSYLAALELIDRTVGGIMGMNEEVVSMLSFESLRDLMAMDPLLDDNHRLMLEELLRERATLLRKLGRSAESTDMVGADNFEAFSGSTASTSWP
ncbi:MAG: hypothetical protein GX604_02805 [Actinobacteria bacterium]|nr:hypothetical protein [Actinomycetota bacterium]